MELRQLAHLVAVVEERSFTRAAERVGVVQSGVSVSVRALEREVGAELVDRRSTPVAPTDAGRAFLPHARAALAAAEAARDAVAEVRSGLRGTVRLGLLQYPRVIDLPGLMAEFLRDRPEVDVRPVFAPGGSAELVQALVDGRVDVAVTSQPGGYPREVRAHRLGSDEVLVACPAGHPLADRARLSWADLDGERFIDFPPGFGVQQSIDHLAFEAGVQRGVVVRVADIAMMVGLVQAGLGLAFQTRHSVGAAPGVVLVPIAPSPVFEIDLALPADRPLGAAAAAFADLVLASSS